MMRIIGILIGVCLVLGTVFCFAQQEELTITTYYPSPYGVYQDMEVYSNMTYTDPGGSGISLRTYIDADSNLHIEGGAPLYHILFDDVNKPFVYLQRYTAASGGTWCENGYVAVNFLKDDKTPANPNSLPVSGYYVCVRGWQTAGP